MSLGATAHPLNGPHPGLKLPRCPHEAEGWRRGACPRPTLQGGSPEAELGDLLGVPLYPTPRVGPGALPLTSRASPPRSLSSCS